MPATSPPGSSFTLALHRVKVLLRSRRQREHVPDVRVQISMAELVVFAADAFAGKFGEDVEDFREDSFVVKVNNALLAIGKAGDIALDCTRWRG